MVSLHLITLDKLFMFVGHSHTLQSTSLDVYEEALILTSQALENQTII